MKHETLATVDLGSNSFHLQIGRVVEEQIYLFDTLREPVRLGAGLTRDKLLDRPTQARALEALGRFAERLHGFRKGAVRAIGTNALRIAKNADQFLAEAEQTLGFPIEVVFGREEARLIYLGVSHLLPPSNERRLVVDVGGGSTEFVIGTGFEPELMESIPMGCVSSTLKYFPDGAIDKHSFRKAVLAAANELERLVNLFLRTGWKEAYASSGTAKTIATILASQGWADHGITAKGLAKLRAHLIKAGDVRKLKLRRLKEDRATVLPGGAAILTAVIEQLDLERIEVSQGALRDGVLYDLLGRERRRDLRDATVQQFQNLSLGSPDWPLIFALRLATLLCRSRTPAPFPPIACGATASGFKVALPRRWLDHHPLTAAALENDAEEWRLAGFRIDLQRR